jgi:thioredoxin 1
MSIVINSDNFEKEVLKSSEPVLVDFWAAWCMPCRMLSPTIDQLAEEYAGKLKVGKLNVDENKEISSKYSVMSIPTVLVFVNGEVVEQFVGVQPKAAYEDAIKKHSH